MSKALELIKKQKILGEYILDKLPLCDDIIRHIRSFTNDDIIIKNKKTMCFIEMDLRRNHTKPRKYGKCKNKICNRLTYGDLCRRCDEELECVIS